MQQLPDEYILNNLNALLEKYATLPIPPEKIKEFKIGKSYFYEIINDDEIRKIQKVLNNYFLNSIPLNNAAVGFRREHSYLHLFEPHRKNYFFLRLDIKSFFHSIKVDNISKVFESYFKKASIEKSKLRLDGFINLTTYNIPKDSENLQFQGLQVLPMGFSTSPAISNIIFRQLDIQIQKICSMHNIVYSRYADDMLFSSAKNMHYLHSKNFINDIKLILSQLNLILNERKTLKAKHTISLNGYTIQYSSYENDKTTLEIRLSQKKLFSIKKIIHMMHYNEKSSTILNKVFKYHLKKKEFLSNEKIKKFYDDQLFNKLIGYRSYLLSFVIFNNKYNCTSSETIQKLLTLVKTLDELIENFK